MLKVDFHEIQEISDRPLKYVVIQAKYGDKWIFVRHKDRTSWEIVGGHIEDGELPMEAAKRELNEETGAIDFRLYPICDYSVDRGQGPTFGRLYYGEVHSLGHLEYEIEELSFGYEMPAHLTYGDIQPYLYEKVVSFVKSAC